MASRTLRPEADAALTLYVDLSTLNLFDQSNNYPAIFTRACLVLASQLVARL
jgi:hypothetical protein